MISEEELLKSLSRQLKYYIDVKRLENGFNTTTSRYQQPAATSLTPLPRASRSSPVRAPSATSRATKGSRDDGVAREREIQRSLKQRMDNHHFLSSPYVNPYIEEERRRYLRQQNAQLLSRRSQKTGYRMVTRSPEPRATRLQTERLIDTASKLLVAIEGADRKKREPHKDDRSESSHGRQSSRENYKTDSDDVSFHEETGRRDNRPKEDSQSGHRRRKRRSTSTQTKTRPTTANPGHDYIRSQSDLLHSRSPSRNARGTQTTASPYESAVRTDSRKKKIHRDRSRSPSSLHSRSPRGGAKTKPVNRTPSSSHSRSPHGGAKTKLVSHKAVDTRSLSDGDSRRMTKERKSHSRSTSASRKHDRSERKVNADDEQRTRSSSKASRETDQTKIRVPQTLSRSTSPIVFPQSSHKKEAVGERELRPKQRVEPKISHSTPRPDEQSNQQLSAKPLSQKSSVIKHVETRTRDDYYETDFGGRIRTDRTNHERRKVRPAAEGKGKLQPITTAPDQNVTNSTVVKPASQRKSSNGKAASEVKEKEPSVVVVVATATDAASKSDKADGRSVTGSQGTRQSKSSKIDLQTKTPPDNVETKSAVSRHSTVSVESGRSVQRPQSAIGERSNASIGNRSQRTVTSRGERDVESRSRSRSSSSSSSTTTIASDKSYSESHSDSGSSTERSVKVKSPSSQQNEVRADNTDNVANSNDTAADQITDEVKKTIHEAVRAGDLKLVDEMLTSQPDLIKSYDNDGLTPLLVAASNGQFDIIAFMVNKFQDAIDLDYRGFTDRAAIHLAAESGQCDCLRILFKLGASVDLQTTEGRTALHFAAIKGDMQCVKFLADDCDADDALDNDGKSAADLAKERGHTDIAVYLQSAFSERRAINRPSADAAANDSNHEDGDSPGRSDDDASEQREELPEKNDDDDDKDDSGSDDGGLFDRTSKTSYLQDDKPPSAEDGTGQGHGRANSASPAKFEDDGNNSDIDSERSSRTSRSEGPDKDKESDKSISDEDLSDAMSQAAGADDGPEIPRDSAAADIQSVRQATQRGDLARLKSLLTSQPDLLNQRDDDGQTLLHCAVISSQFDVVVYLIELAGLDLINARSNTGQTAMQLAARNGLVDCLNELNRAGALPDVKTDDGYTALHLAAQAGHLNAVIYLVEECHVANTEDQHDLLAADLARANGHADIEQYLQEKFSNIDSFTPELS